MPTHTNNTLSTFKGLRFTRGCQPPQNIPPQKSRNPPGPSSHVCRVADLISHPSVYGLRAPLPWGCCFESPRVGGRLWRHKILIPTCAFIGACKITSRKQTGPCTHRPGCPLERGPRTRRFETSVPLKGLYLLEQRLPLLFRFYW